MAAIHITDIEAAINYWRDRKPSPDGVTLAAEIRALAEVYALMVFHHEDEVDEVGFPAAAWEAWMTWYRTTPDTPCIAICSTSQGDDLCKGCGRQFDEVQHWPAMTPAEKRATWRRITMEDSAWRFNRYAERARENERPGGNAASAVQAPASPLSPVSPTATTESPATTATSATTTTTASSLPEGPDAADAPNESGNAAAPPAG